MVSGDGAGFGNNRSAYKRALVFFCAQAESMTEAEVGEGGTDREGSKQNIM